MAKTSTWIGIVALGIGAAWWFLPRGSRPALGARAGRLCDCPDSPNCVASQASDDAHRIDPLPLPAGLDATEARRRLAALLDAEPGFRKVEEGDGYLRYEAVTPAWRFVDDVEFLVDPAARCIHVRSASRIGHSDLGANRRRVGRIRAAWQKAGA